MINANSYTFSVAGAGLRAFAEPISLAFQIGEFTGGLAFQSLHDLVGAAVDDSLTPNIVRPAVRPTPTTCLSAYRPPPTATFIQ